MRGPGDARERRKGALLLALAALAFVALRAPYLSLPLERDEGEYAYIAQRMFEGDWPYRDAFDQKPPGIFLAYAAAFALGGQTIEAVHGLLYVWAAASAALLFALVRRLEGALAAACAVLAWGVASIDPRLGATAANTEGFLALPALGALWCLLRALERGGLVWWWACGALGASACWFKPVAAANLIFTAAFGAVALWRARRPVGELTRAGLGLLAGAASLSLAFGLALAAGGAWEAFLDAVVWHNWRYARSLTLAQGLHNLRVSLQGQAPAQAPLWALALVALAHPRLLRVRTRWLLGGSWLASLAGAAAGLYFRPHYFLQALPALCGLAGAGAGALLRSALEARSAWPARVAALAVAAALLGPAAQVHHSILSAGSPDAISRRLYGLNPFPESRRIADHLRAGSAPGERVLVVGSEPQILFLAARPSATRYIFFYPLTLPDAAALARQREVAAGIEASPPRFVVWVNLPTSLHTGEVGHAEVFERASALLERSYRLELLALPVADDAPYAFFEGEAARARAPRPGAEAERAFWIAVYRREP
jgi:hypothetical protein